MRNAAITLFLLLSLFVQPVAAATATPSGTPTSSIPTDRLEKIKLLKERVATRVAQLQEENRFVTGGEIKEATPGALTLLRGSSDSVVLLSTDTLLYRISESREKIKTSDLLRGQRALVFGKKDKESLVALEVFVREKKDIFIGKVSSVDKTAGTFIVAIAGKGVPINVEKTTKTSRYEGEKGVVKSGFSKLAVGDFVHSIARATKDSELMTAERILIIPGPIISPILTPTAQPKPTTSPS